MAIRIRWVLAILVCVAARAPAQGKCRPADAYTAELLPYLDSLVTQTDTSYAKFRKQLQLLPTTSSNVALVTTEAICARAAAKVDAISKTPASGRSVYVFKLGPTRYGVSDPTAGRRSASERRSLADVLHQRLHLPLGSEPLAIPGRPVVIDCQYRT